MARKCPVQVALVGKRAFFRGEFQRNSIENRCVSIQYAASDPIHDRVSLTEIQGLPGYLLSLFDGHGGWQMADFAMEVFPLKFQKNIKEFNGLVDEIPFLSEQEIVFEAFERAFDSVENGFLKIARKALNLGLVSPGTVGSYALSVFVRDNSLYIANIGRSKCYMCSQGPEGEWACRKLSTLKGNKETDQSQMPKIMMDMREFGDFSLKYAEFSNNKGIFNGPIASHRPMLSHFELSTNDRFLILGSDGLWQFLRKKGLEEILGKIEIKGSGEIAERVFSLILERICTEKGIEKEELMDLTPGKKRAVIHGDISLMVVDLRNQYR